MNFCVLGLSHQTAPVEIREMVAFTPEQQRKGLLALSSSPQVKEAVILSTCNRSEVYALVAPQEGARENLLSFLAEFHQVKADALLPSLYFYEGTRAAGHLFRVAAGLDSMVLGEAQILGQVKEAYFLGLENDKTGTITNKLFHQAIEVGKRVRTETKIGFYSLSVGSVAVDLARKIFGDLSERQALVVGAGETSELVAKALAASGVKTILVTNRTHDKAVEVAQSLGGRAVRFDDLATQMAEADIVISSTGAPHAIIRQADVAQAMKKRRGRPIFLIDIAVPRDIEPQASHVENAFLYDIDDLKAVMEENVKLREQEALVAEKIVEAELGKFQAWLRSREAVPTITALRRRVEDIRKKELERVLPRFKNLSEEDRQKLEAFSQSLTAKFLHEPTTRLLKKAENQEDIEAGNSLRYLFDLEEEKGGDGQA
jgi:glutamyl-tRNA reductase